MEELLDELEDQMELVLLYTTYQVPTLRSATDVAPN